MKTITKSTLVVSWDEITEHLSTHSMWQDAIKHLNKEEIQNGITMQKLQQLLDQAWNELRKQKGIKIISEDFLKEYYNHPTWLINAAFIESDPATITDRMAAVRLIQHINPKKILDYGAGIGTCGRLCSIMLPSAENIDVVEPGFLSDISKKYLSGYLNIHLVQKAEPTYDAIICTEVLEHLLDPIQTLIEINKMLKIGGAFAASWNFYPCLKCHLNSNFKYRRLMLWIVRSLGFGLYGFERRRTTIYSFVKHSEISEKMLISTRLIEFLSMLPIPFERIFLLLRGM